MRYNETMQRQAIGRSGIEASRIGLGTWVFGGWLWGGADDADSIRAVHAALDAGIDLLDTAPVYGFGRSEEVVGEAIAGRRDRVIIATKCGLLWDADAKGEVFFRTDEEGYNERGDIELHRYLGPESIEREVEASLRRLRTDYIDLYQTHWQDQTTAVEDTMACLLKLKDAGKIRAIGVSNAKVSHLERYAAVGQLDSAQERYSALHRGLEDDRLPRLREHGVALLAYSPLENGLLTGKLDPNRRFGPGDLRANDPRFSADKRRAVNTRLGALAPLAQARGLSVTQLVIGWTLAQPGVTHVLCGARTETQARDNAHAGVRPLDAEALSAVEAALVDVREIVDG